MFGQVDVGVHDQIILALIAVITTSVGALVFVVKNGKITKDTNFQISEVNRAVNNIGPGEHRLYDKVGQVVDELEEVKVILGYVTKEIKEHRDNWEKFYIAWDNLPEGMKNANELSNTLVSVQMEVVKIQSALADHVIWEMKKYEEFPPKLD